MRFLLSSLLTLTLAALTHPAFAQSVEVDDNGAGVNPAPKAAPQSGKDKARDYFKDRNREEAKTSTSTSKESSDGAPHLLAVHIGTFFTDNSYSWGAADQRNVGRFNGGVTYRLGEWVNSADLALRLEYTSFALGDGTAKKISVSPVIMFPDANSRFPLYLGAGVGAGLFLQQVHDKSPVALDWQIFGGLRFLRVYENLGVMVEAGVKNHVMLLSDGQFNGVFVNTGAIFEF